MDEKATYWCESGKYQEEADKLDTLIPNEGHCNDHSVDIFRCARNTYYDIMNNGACNMGMKTRISELDEVNEIFETPVLQETIERFENTNDDGDYIDDPDDIYGDLCIEAENMINACIENIDSDIYEDAIEKRSNERALKQANKVAKLMGF